MIIVTHTKKIEGDIYHSIIQIKYYLTRYYMHIIIFSKYRSSYLISFFLTYNTDDIRANRDKYLSIM